VAHRLFLSGRGHNFIECCDAAIVHFLYHSPETLSAVTGPKRDEILVSVESQAVVGKCVAEGNLGFAAGTLGSSTSRQTS
jgi:hypothetical protein